MALFIRCVEFGRGVEMSLGLGEEITMNVSGRRKRPVAYSRSKACRVNRGTDLETEVERQEQNQS